MWKETGLVIVPEVSGGTEDKLEERLSRYSVSGARFELCTSRISSCSGTRYTTTMYVFVEHPVGLHEPFRRLLIALVCCIQTTVLHLQYIKVFSVSNTPISDSVACCPTPLHGEVFSLLERKIHINHTYCV